MINLTPMQKEICRAIEMQGGITPVLTDKHGWTNKGLPLPEFNQLISQYKIVAPRVLTSIPLRIVWQFRNEATRKETLGKIAREAEKLKLKEYAEGGFMLNTPAEEKRLFDAKVKAAIDPRAGRGKSRG